MQIDLSPAQFELRRRRQRRRPFVKDWLWKRSRPCWIGNRPKARRLKRRSDTIAFVSSS